MGGTAGNTRGCRLLVITEGPTDGGGDSPPVPIPQLIESVPLMALKPNICLKMQGIKLLPNQIKNL